MQELQLYIDVLSINMADEICMLPFLMHKAISYA